MLALHEVQTAFRAALIGNDATVTELIGNDGLPPAVRLGIYRNNVFSSLKQVLIDTYPVVCRLVDERFFLYAADRFIRRHPPRQACLFRYGAGFADFLAIFPPTCHLVYLPDVARLEWLMNAAAHADNVPPLPANALACVAQTAAADLVLRLDPSIGLLRSDWPIERIWHANQRDADPDASVDLDSGGTSIEVRRYGNSVMFRLLDQPSYAFRAALASGHRLEDAAELALAEDPRFDLTACFQALFAEESVVGFSVSPKGEGQTS
ncbi:MAG: putative DNA-binding domain-containing protein [Acetobacteraceae bacterium]|nr:putative DNA-binding domain-containing protein [Acetobacteraceae bacterium]